MSILLCLALTLPILASAGESKKAPTYSAEPSEREQMILDAATVKRSVAPYLSAVDDCYKRYALSQPSSTGKLALDMIVHRHGHIARLKVDAPGVKGPQLERCVKKAVDSLHFPERKGFTYVRVPFFYLKTTAKGAGPTITCRSPHGCLKKNKNKNQDKTTKATHAAPAPAKKDTAKK